MKVVECFGTPRQIGRITGETIREEIRKYVGITKKSPFLNKKEWEKWKPVYLDKMQKYLPDVLEEIYGTAEGAGLPEDELLRINMLPGEEIIYSSELDIGCTNICFAAGPDGPILGKNNDMPEGNDWPICIRYIKPDRGIPLVTFTICGVVSAIDGMNAEGIALGHSSVGSRFQQSNYHLPIRLWAYNAHLNSKNTEEFAKKMTELPLRGKGYNILCADRAGVICCFEAACPLMQVRRPKNPMAMNCVNVYQLSELENADRRSEKGKQDSTARMEYLDGVFSKVDIFNMKQMKSLLTHHGEHGICRHGECEAYHTTYSIIAQPRQNRVLYTNGHPCTNEYNEILL